jgi:hypothetical protein
VQFNVRGLLAKETLVLVDGKRVAFGSLGIVGLTQGCRVANYCDAANFHWSHSRGFWAAGIGALHEFSAGMDMENDRAYLRSVWSLHSSGFTFYTTLLARST